jgi:uncharacterized protein YacL
MEELCNLIFEKMGKIIMVITVIGYIGNVWRHTKKISKNKELMRDIVFISLGTITGLVIPIWYLMHAYKMPFFNFLDWFFILVCIILILGYIITFVILFGIKKQIDKDFKGLKMFEED